MLVLFACTNGIPATALALDAPPASTLHEYRSVNGVLDIQLDAREGKVSLGGASFDGMTFNNDYVGPILRVKPGDLLRVHLINHLHEATSLHFHGYQGSPGGHADNVHVVVEPEQRFDYELRIPITQPPGLYWIHPHLHTAVEHQIMGGLSCTLIVEGLAEQFKELSGIREQVFVIKDYEFESSDDVLVKKHYHGFIRSLNGSVASSITMRPGETQLWRFTNQSADKPVRLTLKGHHFRIIAFDGSATTHEVESEVLDIPSAGRVEVLVDAGAPGSYELTSPGLFTDSGAEQRVDRPLGIVTVQGMEARPVPTLTNFPASGDLRTRKVDAQRTVTLTEDPDAGKYFINGKLFDHERMDTRVPLGSVEEWTIRNNSDDYHSFHIHQVNFQVVEINGVAQDFDGMHDTVAVPTQGEIKIRLAFIDPIIVGHFMYHCHVLEHEDKGMMANIEVYDPKAQVQSIAH